MHAGGRLVDLALFVLILALAIWWATHAALDVVPRVAEHPITGATTSAASVANEGSSAPLTIWVPRCHRSIHEAYQTCHRPGEPHPSLPFGVARS